MLGYFLEVNDKDLLWNKMWTCGVSPGSFEILLIFAYFLTPYILSCLTTQEATLRVSGTRYQVCFTYGEWNMY